MAYVWFFSPFSPLPTPFLANTCWEQGLELVNLSSWRRTVYQIPILRPSFLYDCEPGKFYENPDLRLEVNSSEILRIKRQLCRWVYSKTEIRNSSVNWTKNLQSVHLKTSLGRTAPSERDWPQSARFLTVESMEALELCSAGKNERWKVGDRATWPGEHPKRAWSACHRHSPSTPKPDGSGAFSISTKRLQSLTKVYHPQVHLFVVLQKLPDSLEQKSSGSPTLALTIVCGCVGGREPLANFWFLPIHFLFSWQVTLTWTLNAQLGKIGLLGDGSKLREHEPWLGVTFFEQPGKTSLRSHSTVLPWT